MVTTITNKEFAKVLKANSFNSNYMLRLNKIMDIANCSGTSANPMQFFEMVIDDYDGYNAYTPMFTRTWKLPTSFKDTYRSVMSALKIQDVKNMWADSGRYNDVLKAHHAYCDNVAKQLQLVQDGGGKQKVTNQPKSKKATETVESVASSSRHSNHTDDGELSQSDGDDETIDDIDEYHDVHTDARYVGRINSNKTNTVKKTSSNGDKARMREYIASLRSIANLLESELL